MALDPAFRVTRENGERTLFSRARHGNTSLIGYSAPMIALPPPLLWPAAALTVLLGAACASTGERAQAASAPVPSASAVTLAPTDVPAPSASSVAEVPITPPQDLAPAPPPAPEPDDRDPHCTHRGPAPMLCVAPSETEGDLSTSPSTGGAGVCRSTPKKGICGGCRSRFVRFENGQCCYRGLSRFPLCKDRPPAPH